MINPFDKHQFADQPAYHTKTNKINARKQVVMAYREITGNQSIPEDCNYWTLCNRQPNEEGSEIVQLINLNLIKKNQFCGVDYDLKNEGIIEYNKQQHPEANWFKGEWLDVIEENYELFKPGLVYFDYTKTIKSDECYWHLAKTMNICPSGTVLAANLMLSDGHSSRRFDPKILPENVIKYLRSSNDWTFHQTYYPYKSSRTEMATYIFSRD